MIACPAEEQPANDGANESNGGDILLRRLARVCCSVECLQNGIDLANDTGTTVRSVMNGFKRARVDHTRSGSRQQRVPHRKRSLASCAPIDPFGGSLRGRHVLPPQSGGLSAFPGCRETSWWWRIENGGMGELRASLQESSSMPDVRAVAVHLMSAACSQPGFG